ncbi:GAF domain-containing protein [Parvularcula sp. ZS-1/3]|uniref:histidine kinase n=1 Tax=Parvularcula mediterranea TaxID=2732508 RepID=A0A7Y3RNL9_9PROT|nr:HWE histidine kinase domain-containing protein [Parvularcula mediterranea]NNU17402.1 GAF domain-containing protein [Parvularcula mediterranea]
MADGEMTVEELSVENCDKEPIHIPGTVQPFAALIAGPLSLDTVDFASENLAEFLGIEAKSVLGNEWSSVLPDDVLHDIRNVLSFSTSAAQRERVGQYELRGNKIEVYAHRSPGERAIVEFERGEAQPLHTNRSALEQARLFIARAGAEQTVDRMLKAAVVGLRSLSGYDRVKAYRYDDDGSGEVVAEARAPDVPSYLGLRYPAWDVPAQARALQVKNPVRITSDVYQEPVTVLARTADLDPLDMSLAHTRGVSPIHVQYLKNMGVGGTLTIGLVVDGKLWGMFACHHMSPRVITSDVRIACELFGQIMSLLVKEKTESEQVAARARAAAARQQIIAETDATTDLLKAFPSISKVFRKLINCDGMAILRDDKLQTDASVPSSEAIRAVGGFNPHDEDLLKGTDSLQADGWHNGHDLGDTAGCLIVRATAAYPLQLMFFRDEKIKKVLWGGKPEKKVEDSPFGPRISPRGSFDAYQDEQCGRSEPWQLFDLTSAREIQIMLTQITAKGERQQLSRHKDLVTHQRQQDLMIAELNHRVKNILALIRSLSRQAKESSASLESYALALEQRIAALAAAHDLAVSGSKQGVGLKGILDTELVPYTKPDLSQVLMSGPVVGLRPDVAPMIALVFHEIVTNAAKYGALSNGDGIIQVRWELEERGINFRWREVGGPPVEPPKRHGFGRTLIERAIPYEFDGTVDLEYKPQGLEFRFTLPTDCLVDLEEDTKVELTGKVGEIKRVASDQTALLVEDNLVLAMDMVDSISRLGAEHIETAATVETALRELKMHKFDFAVLDMNLRGTVSFEIAERLIELQIPFIFVTGYGSRIDVPPELRDIPILTKPVDDGSLSHALGTILKG